MSMSAVPDAIQRAPFPANPEDFGADERIHFDQVAQTHKLEDEAGEEWEWLANRSKWVPVMDEALLELQQQAYKVKGVDENAPAVDPRKRKAGNGAESSAAKSKKQKAEGKPAPPKQNKAIYVSNLPTDATVEELHQVFSRYGVIDESAGSNEPRIKMYNGDDGNFKGDALIVYFRPESVQLAITMLDDSALRIGDRSHGLISVTEADASYKRQKEDPKPNQHGSNTKGSHANAEREKNKKKNQQMKNRLADWSDDEPSTLPETSSRHDRIVILRPMFTPEDLATDPSAILEIEEDVREECAKLGIVQKVVVYDQDESGAVTVRFDTAAAAAAAVRAFTGRVFDGRAVHASVSDGSERFKKRRRNEADDDEEQRLKGFGAFLEGEKDEGKNA